MRWLVDGITDSMDMGLGRLAVDDREVWCAVVPGVANATEPLN